MSPRVALPASTTISHCAALTPSAVSDAAAAAEAKLRSELETARARSVPPLSPLLSLGNNQHASNHSSIALCLLWHSIRLTPMIWDVVSGRRSAKEAADASSMSVKSLQKDIEATKAQAAEAASKAAKCASPMSGCRACSQQLIMCMDPAENSRVGLSLACVIVL